jgi:hypothetical protein
MIFRVNDELAARSGGNKINDSLREKVIRAPSSILFSKPRLYESAHQIRRILIFAFNAGDNVL